jgi:hypothetical protein
MATFTKVLALLGQENVIKSTGFVAGLTYTIFNDKQMCLKVNYSNTNTSSNGGTTSTDIKLDLSECSIIQNPLSTLLAGSINGVFYAIASSFVGGMLPRKFSPLVPICLGLSMVNSCYKFMNNCK